MTNNKLPRRSLAIAAAGGLGAAVLARPAEAAPGLPPGRPWEHVVATARSIADLSEVATPVNGAQVSLESYFGADNYSELAQQRGTVGAGLMTWQSTVPRSLHNGGTVISPSVPGAADPTKLVDYLEGLGDTAGDAHGCWVRGLTAPLDPTWFGTRFDDDVDNSASFAATVAAAIASGVREISIPGGTLQYSESPNFGYKHLRVFGAGRSNTVLKYTGKEKAFVVDPSPFGRAFITGFALSNLTIEGNADAQVLVYTDQSAHMHFSDISLREVNSQTGIAMDLHASVLGRFESIVCSINDKAMASRPHKILVLDRAVARSEHMQCSTNTFVDSVIEGATGIGIHLIASDQAMFFGGTSEANLGGTGVVIDAVCRYNSFIGMGCEANAQGDFINSGISTQFTNCYSATAIELRSPSRHAVIDGGLHRLIQVHEGAQHTSVRHLTYNYFAAGGGYSDAGYKTTTDALIDARKPKLPNDPSPWGGQYVSHAPPLQTLKPQSSPYTFTNITAYPATITIAGGKIASVSLTRGSESVVLGGTDFALPTFGPFTLSTDDSIVVRYSDESPTVTVIPTV